MRVIFVRHGDHRNNKLTRVGRKQAKLVCHDLRYENIGKVFCSPCGRAVETANIISKKLGLDKPIVINALKEREKLEGEPKTMQEIEYMENYLNPEFSMKHPEGCKEFLERSFKFLEEVAHEDFESILIVGHSSFAYALSAYFVGLNKKGEVSWVRLGNCSKLCYEIVK